MKLSEMFLAQLEPEARRCRRALDHVPDGREDWKPHAKSMPLGRLAMLVAQMLTWFPMIIHDDHLDLAPVSGPKYTPQQLTNKAERLKAFDEACEKARQALAGASDEQLAKPWKLMVAGKVVSEDPRHVVLRDTFMHLSHHRGQLTVYIRLCEAPVPAIYGPSADESRFD
jgi:hypothetical protein